MTVILKNNDLKYDPRWILEIVRKSQVDGFIVKKLQNNIYCRQSAPPVFILYEKFNFDTWINEF